MDAEGRVFGINRDAWVGMQLDEKLEVSRLLDNHQYKHQSEKELIGKDSYGCSFLGSGYWKGQTHYG